MPHPALSCLHTHTAAAADPPRVPVGPGNATITSLDLSHNKIADRGVKAIAKLLDDR